MILYLIKSGACLLSLLTIYHLLLEKEKLLRFNRAWLLFSLLFSFAIPFLPLPIDLFAQSGIADVPKFSWVTSNEGPTTAHFASHDAPASQLVSNWIVIVYVVVVALLLLRFLRNLYLILHRIFSHTSVRLENARLVLLPDDYIPHTFGKAIFLNEKAFREGAVDKEILAHECAHVRQFHTLDILLVEILRIFFWFNPLLIFYKSAIQLNHEFLADEAVTKTYRNPKQYQQLLFQMISLVNPSTLSSPLNYNVTKKRMIMIQQSTPKNGWLKKLATVPFLLGAIIVFSTTIHAQTADGSTFTSRMVLGTEKLGANPYVIIDDKPYPSDILTRISPRCIAATTIISDKKVAEKRYGPIAADGAISITLFKRGLSYATAADRDNLALERSAKSGFYYRLRLKNDDGTPYDKLVLNWGGSASSDQKVDCKVAFIVDNQVYSESQLDELQARLKTMEIGLAGVGKAPRPVPGVDLSSYDVTFYFYSKSTSPDPSR